MQRDTGGRLGTIFAPTALNDSCRFDTFLSTLVLPQKVNAGNRDICYTRNAKRCTKMVPALHWLAGPFEEVLP